MIFIKQVHVDITALKVDFGYSIIRITEAQLLILHVTNNLVIDQRNNFR